MISRFQRLLLFGFVLFFAGCSIPGGEQENELMDGVRRYIVKSNYDMKENMYLVFDAGTKKAVIIDPGAPSPAMEKFIAAQKLDVTLILNTHGHFDHVLANQHYRELYHAVVLAHPADAEWIMSTNPVCKPDRYFSSEEELAVPFNIKIIATPGHTDGSVCYMIRDRLFSGDTLFNGSIGRVWGTTAAEEQARTAALVEVIKAELLVLPENTFVFPGHGEFTHIGHEKQYNPFLR